MITPKDITTRIEGYRVELGFEYEEGAIGGNDYVSSCYVSFGKYASSLAVLNDFGTLEADRGETLNVRPDIIEEIEHWALDHGY